MEWKDVAGLVSKLAPTVATALGGPLAGGAVSALEGVFGLTGNDKSNDDRQSALAAAIAGASPDQLVAMKKMDLDFQVQMAELGFKDAEAIAQIAESNQDSARKREEVVKDSTPTVLAYATTIGFFGILAAIMFAPIPAGVMNMLNIMLGILGTCWTGVFGYYFGSSAGDMHKTNLLAQANAQQ